MIQKFLNNKVVQKMYLEMNVTMLMWVYNGQIS